MLMGVLLAARRSLTSPGGPAALRTSHYRVLEAVGRGGVRVSDIGERVGVTTQAAGQFVSALVESGHLVQVPDPSDGRARLVSRTAAGTRAVRLVRRRIAALEATWADQVGPQRYATFRSVLRDLNDRDREGRPKPV